MPQRLWTTVSDPTRLPEWWPGVQRVEDVSRDAWTTVMITPKGRTLRADYSLVSKDHPGSIRWRQEVDESPFERILAAAVTELALHGADGETEVTLTQRLSLRGFSRLGGFQVRRAARKQLDGALDGLEALAASWRGD